MPKMPKRITLEEFIQKAQSVHGNIYNYTKSIYINATTKLCIICKDHGEFFQRPNDHISGGNGCPKCTGRCTSTNDWIKKAQKVHGDDYDYSKVQYTYAKSKVIIICKDHGEFEQEACSHIMGIGCNGCGLQKRAMKKRDTLEDFIEKAKLIHGNTYDYTKSKYEGTLSKIDIICNKHGCFQQTPNNHLQGKGCSKCAHDASAERYRLTPTEFLERAKKAHGDKYIYKNLEIDMKKGYISIICPEHGQFYQNYSYHITGRGCSQCGRKSASLILVAKRICSTIQFIEKAREIQIRILRLLVLIMVIINKHLLSI